MARAFESALLWKIFDRSDSLMRAMRLRETLTCLVELVRHREISKPDHDEEQVHY